MSDKTILKGMIEIYQNEFMCGYDGPNKDELRIIFLELIVHATQYINDFRYCSNPKCPCSPEFGIGKLMRNHGQEINSVLFGGEFGLSEVPMQPIRDFLNRFNNEGDDEVDGRTNE